MTRLAAVLAALTASPALAAGYQVNPDAGNNTFTAVFDAALGERITAQSSSVGCTLDYDAAAGVARGTCSVPLGSIVVDNEPTKTEHFQQWTTNKKSDPKACAIEARFEGVKVGQLKAETPAPFETQATFTVCGRARAGGAAEKVTGTVILLPAGTAGAQETLRIRAHVTGFDRDAYRIGPRYTDGWLARVQSLAKVVAEQGDVDVNVFARPAAAARAATR
ncbi:MAG TPA: hypothetical protein VFP50_00765 [Anaeromyxobacteraceae bacterium]|nr:hypothetical protein [Anaeromyxobacteraceae bacterium]